MTELEAANFARYYGDDRETHAAIVRSLARMPEEVREFAVHECVFISVGRAVNGICRPTSMIEGANWLIFISERLAPSSLESVVAHEVAHAYLNHDFTDITIQSRPIEDEVRGLIRAWGFRGYGAEPLDGARRWGDEIDVRAPDGALSAPHS